MSEREQAQALEKELNEKYPRLRWNVTTKSDHFFEDVPEVAVSVRQE